MTTRARRPTDETGTEVLDPERRRALFGASPGERIAPAPDTWELDATQVTPRPDAGAGAAPVERSTPTSVDPRPPIEQGTPTELIARPERSEPMRVISMKDRATGRPPPSEPRVPLHVQLRSMAEVAGVHEPACALGRLAPPRDPRQARARRRRANFAWACVAIALACGISLAIWLVAGR
ncbi:MAG TPA: hypothetical protein VGD37_35880 [Kofleriaceae bacterium]|jgi:hypothetical protein